MWQRPGRPVKPSEPSRDADPGTTPDDESLDPARSPTGGPDVGDARGQESAAEREFAPPSAPVEQGGHLERPPSPVEQGGHLERPSPRIEPGSHLELPTSPVEQGGATAAEARGEENIWNQTEELEALEREFDRPGAEITAVETSPRRDGEHREDKLNYIQSADRELERIESEANAALEQLAAAEREYKAQVLKLAEDADARVRDVQDRAEAALRTQLARIRAETEQRLRAAEVEPHAESRSEEAAPPT